MRVKHRQKRWKSERNGARKSSYQPKRTLGIAYETAQHLEMEILRMRPVTSWLLPVELNFVLNNIERLLLRIWFLKRIMTGPSWNAKLLGASRSVSLTWKQISNHLSGTSQTNWNWKNQNAERELKTIPFTAYPRSIDKWVKPCHTGLAWILFWRR